MEYLLIECREREISTPAAFGTHKEAHDEMCKWVAAVLSGAIMLILTTVFKKHQRIQELALGIAMLGGMFLTQAIMG